MIHSSESWWVHSWRAVSAEDYFFFCITGRFYNSMSGLRGTRVLISVLWKWTQSCYHGINPLVTIETLCTNPPSSFSTLSPKGPFRANMVTTPCLIVTFLTLRICFYCRFYTGPFPSSCHIQQTLSSSSRSLRTFLFTNNQLMWIQIR